LRDRLSQRINASRPDRFVATSERIWHWGLDGPHEREQTVLRFGRALVFIQIHPYGDDLFVSWDAHVNYGTWSEKHVASGIDRATGKRISLMAVEPSAERIGEYDVSDLNALAEWTHLQVTQELRQLMKEREIDQEIDFAIIRADRNGIEESTGPKKASRRFRRTA